MDFFQALDFGDVVGERGSTMRNGRRGKQPVDLFEASLATGIGQALAGWAAEYTHSMLENDPDLRKRLRQNWLFIFERIAQGLRESEQPKRRRPRRSARQSSPR